MKIRLNGSTAELDPHIKTMEDLLAFYQLIHKTVMIEHNETILDKESYDSVILKDGDVLEMVHFVGGG
ncbi:sulfur carrier protein ThiS [Metabacillus indicus]|uniref:Thiamine biosynthesis protein ThiS n=1 Tax=Metabacillus indicus TaxID=246786 RepID=A0A084H1N2_METID|nr:sulfur carrier protein ThiS [Metabacillus indicus]KEZ53494.1 thiamine biosynthesis protein ThiS [Metabacillus indicus]